jgi:hypothetical protein
MTPQFLASQNGAFLVGLEQEAWTYWLTPDPHMSLLVSAVRSALEMH